jgi:hypothetical protein
MLITVNFDLKKIDASRIKNVTRRNGDEARFLEIVLIESPGSQFGDYIVKQAITKEERLAGKEMPIIGDGKIFQPQGGQARQSQRPARKPDLF